MISGYRGFLKRKREMKDGKRKTCGIKEGADAGCKAGAHTEGDRGNRGWWGKSSPKEGAGRESVASAFQTPSHSQPAEKF